MDADADEERDARGRPRFVVPDPAALVDPKRRTTALGLSVIVSVVLMVALQAIDLGLRTPEAPLGIVSLELAFSPTKVEAILASWTGRAPVLAGMSLGLDYLFLVAYTAALVLAVSGLARLSKRPRRVAGGLLLAWAMLASGVLDAAENYAMLRLLLGASPARWAPLATALALAKFLVIAVGLVYVFFFSLRRLPTLVRGR